MNPWDIQKLEDLLVFHCPECNAIEKSREVFLNHALTKHENAKEFLEKFMQDEDYKYLIKDELQVKSEIDEEEESFEDLLSVCGINEIKSKSRYPRSMGFSLKNFIKNEIRKRKMKLGISLPHSKSSKI